MWRLKINFFDWANTVRYRKKFESIEKLHVNGRANLHISGTGKVYATKLSVSPSVDIYVRSNAKVILGKVFLNSGVSITCFSQVIIEDETMVGSQTEIMDNDWHGIDGNPAKTKPIHIGKHVWIGIRCIILKGVTIGDCSIVGAGSVVTQSIPPNTIFAGNPAKQIGTTKSGYSN
jgi:acetyltransferase-like isoleucine patch superfamily enzyme